MQVRRAAYRPFPHCRRRAALRWNSCWRPSAHVAAGVLALLLAAPPASPSALTTLTGDAPTAEGDRPVPESAAPAGSPRQRAIFVCEQDGVPVFTDRPCGSATEPRTLSVDAPAPGAAPSTAPPRPRASTRPRLQPERQAGTGRAADTRCATLRRTLDELDERMRAGYSSREAARLWSRWRDLKDRLRAERC